MEELTKAEKRKQQQHEYYLKVREKKLAAAKERYIKKTQIVRLSKEPTYEELLAFREKILAAKKLCYLKKKSSKKIPEVAPEEKPEEAC